MRAVLLLTWATTFVVGAIGLVVLVQGSFGLGVGLFIGACVVGPGLALLLDPPVWPVAESSQPVTVTNSAP